MSISTTKKLLGATVAAGMIFALSACGQAPTEKPGGTTSDKPAASDFLPCIVSDMGGFDDKSFNQLSFEGAQKAADELGVKLKDVQSNAETEYGPNITNLVDEGCNAIVAVGFALSAATVEAANANPDIDFILVDDAADNDFDGKKDAENVKPLLYDTAQAAFLAGYLSAGYSKTGKVGTYGGMEFPTVTIFMDGYLQGVNYYNEVKGTDVKVVGWDGKTGSFTGGFEANPDAKQVAVNILNQGVDVILPVGGPIYQSAQQAIKESGKDIALIGADADLFVTDPSTADVVLTSVLKAMDLSTYQALLASGEGEFDATAYIGTLDNEGVGIADLHNFSDKVDSGLQDEVKQLRQDIIDGKVEVTSYLSK
ncbi:Nucleoside ABC transporter, periplasmic nucleoside-binding protein [Microbacterium esteraromaticum]|uniref:Nucleoside ABC transporter, periplasmic nucleoside-binding protein n=1 Tax=Microbacterium esteraromaticum TaxID=57043 RepID=A0A1R4JSK1_9MICO|nr:BMP family ABC transporter substrate-binding protein [Microbacterium esteraromaticum]SJN35050.1 Nucleoside ABC transporter, periplasmic nucleoside-binding protein [Microbacterium esteraromaticum]